MLSELRHCPRPKNIHHYHAAVLASLRSAPQPNTEHTEHRTLAPSSAEGIVSFRRLEIFPANNPSILYPLYLRNVLRPCALLAKTHRPLTPAGDAWLGCWKTAKTHSDDGRSAGRWATAAAGRVIAGELGSGPTPSSRPRASTHLEHRHTHTRVSRGARSTFISGPAPASRMQRSQQEVETRGPAAHDRST